MRIDVEDIVFSYSNVDVLKGVSLQIAEEDIVCVVGPNGSGKSTLVKCIESLLVPRSGMVLFDGIDSRTLGRMETAKLVGYVPQSTNQFFPTNVFDTILMGRRPYSSWHSGEKDIDKVIDIITRMDLDDIALRDFNHLSGGQQQRVLIARSLAQEPQALLLDEPTSSLDIAHQLEVMDIIHDLVHRHRISVLMIVHDLNLASRYADKIVMLCDGQVYAVGSPEEVLTVENLAHVYCIEAAVQRNNGSILVQPIARCAENQHSYDEGSQVHIGTS